MRLLAAALLALLCGAGAVQAAPPETLDGGDYGPVHAVRPAGSVTGFVVLFSRGAAWATPDEAAAAALAAKGAFVVGVDTGAYLAHLAALPETCHHLPGDAEALSHQIQRELGTRSYHAPIMAGIGQGGRLAEAALAEAPANTIAGAVSVDPDPRLDPRARPCPAETPGPALPGFWEAGLTADVPAAARQALEAERARGVAIGLHALTGPEPAEGWIPALVAPHLGERPFEPESLADLPLVELPALQASDRLAIVISGDGGWRDIDKTIAEDLRQAGVNVVGWDSLRYFWSGRTPERTAQDLARIMRTYAARWHAPHVALIGYSFGADVIPFAYNRLPAALRGQVSLIGLLGFAPKADFEIRVGGWLGLPPSSDALPVKDEIARVPPALVQCFYGAREDDTACPGLEATGVTVIRTAGEHHFDGDYHRLAHVLLQGWAERLKPGPPK